MVRADHSLNTLPPPPSLTVVCGELGNSGEQVSPGWPVMVVVGGQGRKLSPLPQAWVASSLLGISGQGRWSFCQHVDEGGGEESSLVRSRLQDTFHPVIIFSLLGQDHYDVSLLECKLIFIVRLTIIERTTSFITVKLVSLK